MKNRKVWFALLFSFILIFATACGSGGEAEPEAKEKEEPQTEEASATVDGWSPNETIEVVAPGGAGGGWDTTARTVAQVLTEESLVSESMPVVNKSGSGGAIGWSYVDGKQGDNHTLFVTSSPILLVPLNGGSELGHNDFEPIAGVIADFGAFVTNADSEYQNINDVVEALKADPSSVTVTGDSAPGSMDHIQFVKAMKAAGVDITKIDYVPAGDIGGMTLVLGGDADVYSTGLAEAAEQAKAGNVRVLAITSPEPLEGDVISEFQTLRQQGIEDEFINWRGFMAPKGMEAEAVKYYENAIESMYETALWQERRDNFGWKDNFMSSEEFGKFLDEQYAVYEALMGELGL
ncbi:tripartite tricarboxylate transporter substrate binding protein [Chengkuizengella axinellae]|uniref:Tripartite tricarboxylate transporter substrate binding protein n=1 Tax=Chengkuizengella axinellae TaxID=3064388 RepID=A0ABT9J5J5_9BACL|nr:tripartite tricarboxylate transporter substrate binding protein [Chengkuizengella sp. 2205SS18-9]MDP5276224.1 tripartite tricarboxylate transporter substrate binding protein [Chengkuizengella sp. 2205SS18-9]